MKGNQHLKGTIAWNRGIPRTDEVKKKISIKVNNYYANGGKGPMYWLGKKQPRESVEKMRAKLKGMFAGSKNPMWKGGITNPRVVIMRSQKYKDWRMSVFKRDRFCCRECKAMGVYLQADHIKSFANFPKLRFEISNGRTLCIPCHRKTPNYGWKAVNSKKL